MQYVVVGIDIFMDILSTDFSKHLNSGSICDFNTRNFKFIGIGKGNPFMGGWKGL